MIRPYFRKKSNGVPVLSREEINTIAESYVQDYQEDALTDPEPFDVEGFLELYMGMTPDFQYLSHNGIYLGMTVFNETDKLPVYDPLTRRAEYIHADANTVIIDRRLIEDDKQEHRLRFTQGHEAGHGIFHTQCFYRDPNQLSLFSLLDAEEDIPMIRCRTDSIFSHASSDPRNWSDNERMEWQANAMSSALLLPRPAVRHLFEVNGRTGSRCSQIIKTIYDLIDECNVSHEAALYRLKDLGIVQTNEVRSFMPGSSLMDFGRLL